MAKRRRLEAPKREDLENLEEGFARETTRGMFSGSPPIAQVAGEAAALSEMAATEDRAARAQDARDAERMRAADAAGLLIEEIPITDINVDGMVRDRVALDREAMVEMKASISSHGLRMPIEVMAQADGYALISGFRRLLAMRELLGETGDKRYAVIRAIVRAPLAAAEAFVAMVEENEIRSDLSHYERGRIAVMAAGQGAFPDTDAAIAALFASASKAKRSKIRSFALVHEELGDVLSFPSALSERSGLRVSHALRSGYAEELRKALEAITDTPEAELAAMDAVIKRAEAQEPNPARGGRPRRKPDAGANGRFDLANGRYMVMDADDEGYFVRFHGPNVDADLISTVLHEIHRLLGPSD